MILQEEDELERVRIEVGQAFSEVAAEYDGYFARPIDRAEDACVKRRITAVIDKHDTKYVLDLGCGTGLYLDWFGDRTDYYAGVDLSPLMLQKARAKHRSHRGASLFHGSFTDMRGIVPTNYADLTVSTFGSMSYEPDLQATRLELHRTLRPGGRFFLMFFTDKYHKRENHILHKKVPIFTWTARHIAQCFGVAFTDVSVTGLNYQDNMKSLTDFGMNTYGRLRPDSHYYLIVEGTKDNAN